MFASHRHPTKPRPARGFVVFRFAVYALLLLDVGLYARHGRPTELLDTAAWCVLLALFECETGGWTLPARAARWLHALRWGAMVAIGVAVVGYAVEREWLDFGNEMTWLAVVALIEVEMRLPRGAHRLHRLRRLASAVGYLVLVGVLLAWAVEGIRSVDPRAAWLDAWDALLWLVAFWTIELNVFGLERTGHASRSGHGR